MTNPALFNPHLEGEAFFWEAGPTGVLLVHGFTATTAEVRPMAKKIYDRGFTVAGPLLPGHGTSPQDLNRIRWTDWIQSVDETVQHLRARSAQVVVAGESAGAVICLYLASKHPEIECIILAAPALKLNLSPFQILELRLLAPFVTAVSKGKMDGSKNWQGYSVNPLKGVLQLLQLQDAVMQRLSVIRQPILIFQGRHDTTIDPHCGEIILSQTCSTVKKLIWMENSSHVVMLDNELDQVVAETLHFLSAL